MAVFGTGVLRKGNNMGVEAIDYSSREEYEAALQQEEAEDYKRQEQAYYDMLDDQCYPPKQVIVPHGGEEIKYELPF